MEWHDEGVILSVRRHGETGAIAELLTAGHGRCLGLVRGGRSRRQRPVLQPGNRVQATWRARLDEHLGTFAVEPLQLAAGHYRIDYQFESLTRLALLNAGEDETLLITSGTGSTGFEVAAAGRYQLRVEPNDDRAAWQVVYRQIALWNGQDSQTGN